MPDIERHASEAGPHAPPARRVTPEFEDELDPGRHLRVFARHPLLLLAGTVLGGLAALLLTMTQPARYESVTTLMAHLPARTGTGGVDRASLRAFLENQTLVTQVLEELGLNRPPHAFTPQRFSSEALRVEETAGTNLFRLRVQLGDPQMAEDASRRLAHKAVALNRQVASDAGGVLRTELKPHLDEAASRLQTASERLVTYQQTHQIDLLQAESDALVAQRGELFQLLLDIERERGRLKTAEEELRRRNPVLSAERSPAAEEALRRAARSGEPGQPARNESNGGRSGLGRAALARPAGPDGKDPQDQPVPRPRRSTPELETVDPESLDLSNALVNPVYQTLDLQIATSRARLAGLERQRAELARRVGGSQVKELTSLYQRQIELAKLQNEHKLAQQVFDEVSLRFERARADLMGGSAYLQIIDEAVRPDRPMPRKRIQTVALGMLSGLLVGALAALLRESQFGAGIVARPR